MKEEERIIEEIAHRIYKAIEQPDISSARMAIRLAKKLYEDYNITRKVTPRANNNPSNDLNPGADGSGFPW